VEVFRLGGAAGLPNPDGRDPTPGGQPPLPPRPSLGLPRVTAPYRLLAPKGLWWAQAWDLTGGRSGELSERKDCSPSDNRLACAFPHPQMMVATNSILMLEIGNH
jgi:hypothetical protein